MENLDHQYDRADYGYEKNVHGGNYGNDGYRDGGYQGGYNSGYDEIH